MFKFRVLLKIIGGIILINLMACDSLKKALDIDNTNSLASLEPITSSNISSDLITLPNKTKSKLESHISSITKSTLAEYYNETYIDSLRNVLIETGNLKINVFESFLIDHIKSNALNDTIYLANLYLISPSKAEIVSFSYDVKKDDVLFYQIKNTKSNTLKKIEITEGETIRFLKNNLKKKETVKGQVKINADNILTLNISNDNFIKNKGFFESKLKISIKKIAPSLNLKIEIKPDTIVESKLVESIVSDTIYTVISNKSFNLGSQLDLTKEYYRSFYINIDHDEDFIGWGYWIGLNKHDIAKFNELSTDESPLIIFSKNEIMKGDNQIKLPMNTNKEVELIIKNESLDVRSYNYASNFAFYKTDHFTVKGNKKAEVFIKNNSTLYDYNISYNVISVAVSKRKKEIMKDIIVLKNYIHITLREDE
tara:strand:- start:15175 stop:16449 length:1275 start_codon:yes stop_codon:yes gene_type:complete